MARKKIEPITNLGEKNKLTVQKSLPLFSLWQSKLTLSEFKILDTYLSRIDSHRPEKRTVVFEKGELENLLGVKKINNQDLKTRLKHLMGHLVEIPDYDSPNGFKIITLFEEVEAEQDSYGLWQIKLECTQKAMKYIFNIENLGYLRYKLRSIIPLTSRYTYIMFLYLEANRYRKSWEVSLDDLKSILNCNNEETYKTFKRFNDLILKKIHREMHEKTECQYSYEPIKKGRSVVAIRFTYLTKNQLGEQLSFDDLRLAETTEREYSNDNIALLAEACGNEFSEEEMQVIFNIISEKTLPENQMGIWFARERYLSKKYADLNYYEKQKTNEGKKIQNRFQYFKKMLKKD